MLARRNFAAVSTGTVQGSESSKQPYNYGAGDGESFSNHACKLPRRRLSFATDIAGREFALPSVMC